MPPICFFMAFVNLGGRIPEGSQEQVL